MGYILKELADACPRLAGVPAYAAAPERALQRDYPIKPYPAQLTSEEKARFMKEEALGTPTKDGQKPPPIFALCYPSDEAHPVFPGASGCRHRMLIAGTLGKNSTY